MKKISTTLFLLGFALIGQAQQQANYTQYMFNGMSINPAYIGSHDAVSFTALGRWQWVGLEGAPRSQTFSVHSPIQSNHMGLGFQVSRDQIAVSNFTNVMAGYSYRIDVGGGTLSMGLQGGVQSYHANYNDAYTLGNDPSFQENFSAFRPNFGTGLFYYNSLFYAGVSVPELITNDIKNGSTTVFSQRRHYFVTGGVMLALSPNVKMKPNFLVKIVDGAPVSVDYNVNFLLKEVLWLGVSYRAPESVSFLVEVNVNQRLRFGYALDYVTDPSISEVSHTSHELLLNYRLSLSKDKVITPRYF